MLLPVNAAVMFGKLQGKGKTMLPYQKFSIHIFENITHTPPKAAKAPKHAENIKSETLDGLGGLGAVRTNCKIICFEQFRSIK